VTQAVFGLGPPKQLLVVERSGMGTTSISARESDCGDSAVDQRRHADVAGCVDGKAVKASVSAR
jgi:hypothetical protein